MRALVVFESMFGNTEVVARAVAEGIAPSLDVDVVEAGQAPGNSGDSVLLVVGAPTHAFGMSRPSTRRDAQQRARGGIISQGIGVREWVGKLQPPGRATAAAAFDTRIDKPRIPGSAARGIERRLRGLGFDITLPAESFFVTDVAGPLLPDEAGRAREWGSELAAVVMPPTTTPPHASHGGGGV